MYVKWEWRGLHKELNGRSLNLAAVLVEGCPENGRTGQSVVACLGAIDQRFLLTKVRNMKEFHQGLFWAAVDQKLDHLNLDAELRGRIEADILKTVSRPDPDWALWGITCIPRFDP